MSNAYPPGGEDRAADPVQAIVDWLHHQSFEEVTEEGLCNYVGAHSKEVERLKRQGFGEARYPYPRGLSKRRRDLMKAVVVWGLGGEDEQPDMSMERNTRKGVESG